MTAKFLHRWLLPAILCIVGCCYVMADEKKETELISLQETQKAGNLNMSHYRLQLRLMELKAI